MAKYGYARVSTQDQNLHLQIDALKKYGCDRIFKEKMTGTAKSRPELDKLLKVLQKDDVVVIWKLSRLGRSMQNLTEIVNDFKKQGVHFVSLTESFDTSTTMGKFIFHVFAAFAELERDTIGDNTKAGLEAARNRGVRLGRPPVSQAKIDHILHLFNTTDMLTTEIAKECGVSVSFIYNNFKHKKQRRTF